MSESPLSEPSKSRLVQALLASLRAGLEKLEQSQRTVQAGAIHEETRQEDPKDTRAIEAQYLARGLADRVETLQGAVAALASMDLPQFGASDPVAIGAVVTLQEETDAGELRETSYFLVPAAGGEAVEVDGLRVLALTPQSPLGEELMGRTEGEDVEADLPGGRLEARLLRVR